jgi:uncharacterized protein YggE
MKPLDRRRTLLVVVSSLLFVACSHAAHSHHPPTGPHGAPGGPRGVTVMGVGEVKAAPDIARVNVGVEVRAPDAERATAEANERMAAVLGALKGAGVAEGDLRTHSFSVSFEREYPQPPQPVVVEVPTARGGAKTERLTATAEPPQAPAGTYRVSNMVEATLRDLSRISQVIGDAIKAGANQFWGVSFELSDPAPLVSEARARAVAKASANAEQLAQLTGVKLGPVVAIQDGAVSQGPVLTPLMGTMRMEGAVADSVPVERGEITITHQVTLHYGLPGCSCGHCE